VAVREAGPGMIPIERLEHGQVVRVSSTELDELLAAARVIRHEEVASSGSLRVLGVDGSVVFQEQTPDGDLLLRRVASEEEAGLLVDERLATYERMWDGCGCRIDYYR